MPPFPSLALSWCCLRRRNQGPEQSRAGEPLSSCKGSPRPGETGHPCPTYTGRSTVCPVVSFSRRPLLFPPFLSLHVKPRTFSEAYIALLFVQYFGLLIYTRMEINRLSLLCSRSVPTASVPQADAFVLAAVPSTGEAGAQSWFCWKDYGAFGSGLDQWWKQCGHVHLPFLSSSVNTDGPRGSVPAVLRAGDTHTEGCDCASRSPGSLVGRPARYIGSDVIIWGLLLRLSSLRFSQK